MIAAKHFVWILMVLSCMEPATIFSQLGSTPWPMFRHDSRHTGRSPSIGAQTPQVRWMIDVYTGYRDRFNCSPAIDSDGTIYIGTWGKFFSKYQGVLYAFTPEGTIRWQFDPGPPEVGWGTIESTPAIGANGRIYFGRGDYKFYAVSADSGRKKWEFATFPTNPIRIPEKGGQVFSSPVLASDGIVYFATYRNTPEGTNALFAIKDAGDSAVFKWRFPAQGSLDSVSLSSPAQGLDGKIYFGTRGGSFYCLEDAGDSARVLWVYRPQLLNWFDSSPAIGSDGTVHVGSTEIDGAKNRGRFHALNAQTGDTLWTYTADEPLVYASPAVDDSTVYFATGEFFFTTNFTGRGRLYAMDSKRGKLRWIFDAQMPISSSPSIGADGTIYFGAGIVAFIFGTEDRGNMPNGKVFALHPQNGQIKWAYTTKYFIPHSSPAIGKDGTIYIGDAGAKLYAIGGPTVNVETPNIRVTAYMLSQNYPNPFNPITNIRFRIMDRRFVSLKICDLLGREVATLINQEMNPGSYVAQWNASGLASAVYLYRLQAGNFVDTKKLILMR